MLIDKSLQTAWTEKKISITIFSLLIFFSPIAIASHSKTGSIISGLLILFSLGLCWQKTRLHSYEKLFFTSILFFILALALSTFNSEVLTEGLSRLGRYVKLLFFIPIYLTLKRLSDQNIFTVFTAGVLVANFILFGWGIHDSHLNNAWRASGNDHPIFFGNLAAINCIVLFCYSISYWKTMGFIPRLLIALSILTGLYACYLSGTRGAWLALIITLTAFILLKTNTKILITMAVTASILVVLTFFIAPDNSFQKRNMQVVKDIKGFINKPNNCSSIGARFNMWRNAYLIANESPILGTGLGDFKEHSKQLVREKKSFANCKIIYLHTAHSNYFHFLAEAGLIGLVTLLFLFLCGFYSSYRSKNNAWMILLTFFVFGMTTTWLAKNLSLQLFIIYFSISFLSFKSSPKDP